MSDPVNLEALRVIAGLLAVPGMPEPTPAQATNAVLCAIDAAEQLLVASQRIASALERIADAIEPKPIPMR